MFFVESICDDPEIIAENIRVRCNFTPSVSNVFFFHVNVYGGWDVALSVKFQNFPPQQVKFGSPDYVDRDIDEAMEDFIQRIDCYRASYMPIDDERDR